MIVAENQNEIRREQTYEELKALHCLVLKWLKVRRDADRDEHKQYVGRHETQLKALESLLSGALKALEDNLGTLSQLCSMDAGGYKWPNDIADGWSKYLLGTGSMANDRSPEQARLVAAASLSAWTSLAPLESRARSSAAAILAKKTRTTLIESAMPGTRAQFTPSGEMPGKGEELAGSLLAAVRRQRHRE